MSLIKKLLQFSQKLEMQKLVHGATDVGRLRSGNEDSFTIAKDKNLFIVADGMGGHNAGDVASSQAVKMTDEFLTTEKLTEIRGDIRKTRETFIRSLLYAHENILKIAQTDPRYEGMGCTIVAALIFGNNLHLCHVGDARAYICNENGITLLTRDHSYVMDMVINGKLSLEEARVSPLKNKLHQAIGAATVIKPDYKHCFLKEGDKILLCSDGLWDMLSDDQLHTVLKQDKPVKKICEILINMANDAGGHDNITALVIQHKEQSEESPDPSEEELELLKSIGEYSFVFTHPIE